MWLLPSYMRPQKVAELTKLESMKDAPIYLRLHQDDPLLSHYYANDYPDSWTVITGKTLKLGPTWNETFELFPDEEYYGFIGDDCIPRPDGWWKILADVAGTTCISYPDDTIHGERLCTHPCVGGDFIRALGWWANPGLDHSFVDTSLLALGLRFGVMRYVPEVVFEHQHPIKGTAELDATYERGQESYAMDETRFKAWIRGNRSKMDVRRLEKFFTAEKQKHGAV